MARIKKTVDTAGVATYTEEETSIGTDFIDGLMGPFGFFAKEEDTFYSRRTLAIATLGYGLTGIVVGNKVGDRIPILNRI